MNEYKVIAQGLYSKPEEKVQIDLIKLFVKADSVFSACNIANGYLIDIDNDTVIISCVQYKNKFGQLIDDKE